MGLDMKKVTKGIVAAGLGAALLVGGAGTMAVWTEDETVGGGAINAGHLNLVTDGTNAGCGDWMLDTGESVPSTYTAGDPLVPGDVLTRDCAYTIEAEGNHLRATVGRRRPSNFSGHRRRLRRHAQRHRSAAQGRRHHGDRVHRGQRRRHARPRRSS